MKKYSRGLKSAEIGENPRNSVKIRRCGSFDPVL